MIVNAQTRQNHGRPAVSFVASLALAVAALGSCSSTAGLAIRADRSAVLSVSVDFPAAVEARLRSLSGAGASSGVPRPLVDSSAVSAAALSRGMSVVESATPDARSYRGAFSIGNLEGFVSSDPDLAASGALTFARGPGWASLTVMVTRANAAAVVGLFPGIDEELLEALSPPALYDLPVTVAEYRSMLAALLGRAAAEAIDASAFSLSITVPGPIMRSEGGVASGRTLGFSMPALDAMTLEEDVRLFIQWKE